MQHPYLTLVLEYTSLLAQMRITNPALVRARAVHLLNFKERYTQVWAKTGIPVIVLAALNERESGSDFHTYFGNGDNLLCPTIHVPKGRGPFATWEAGCIDASHLDRLDQVARQPGGWIWARAGYEVELYNGFGPRNHGFHSGYPWAGTNIYTRGNIHLTIIGTRTP
jgi:lysozyme family protein